jgi:hypothetical protein
MKRFAGLLAVLVLLTSGWAQYQFGVVGSSSTRFATAPSNSHKLAYHGERIEPQVDTVTLVFQSNDSIYLSLSGNGTANPWSNPVGLYPGADPGISTGQNRQRHLVWQMRDTVIGSLNIFYRNLEYRMQPVNVSTASQDCFHPDVYGDSVGVAHIVWEENEGAGRRVYYRQANASGVIGERFPVASQLTGGWALPAIEKFNDGISVIWAHFDSTQNPAYKIIRRRQIDGVWQPEEVLVQHNEPLSRPALDFGGTGENFSACWDRVVNGNSEVQFYGGNGGGYSTAGSSTAPVVSTVGSVWSYLFWQEDSAGIEDINTHFYYFMTGWSPGYSIRRLFVINEPVYAPSGLGALAVWTQGDNAPYQVMWGFFGYPIGVQERAGVNRAKRFPTVVSQRLVLPAAGNGAPAEGRFVLTSITGSRVLELKPGVNDLSRLAPGVYFIRTPDWWQRVVIVR